MPSFRITARCPNAHVQDLVLHGYERKQAVFMAKLMDGSIAPEVRERMKNDHTVVVGRCGICSQLFDCDVTEVPDGTVYEGAITARQSERGDMIVLERVLADQEQDFEAGLRKKP